LVVQHSCKCFSGSCQLIPLRIGELYFVCHRSLPR
jgi:hypothetical protein